MYRESRSHMLFCMKFSCEGCTLLHFLLLTEDPPANIYDVLFHVAHDENCLPKQLMGIGSSVRSLARFCHSNIDRQCLQHGNPFILASRGNNDRLLSLLIRYGAGIEEGNMYGMRAVHWTTSPSSLEILHSAGASLSSIDGHGYTPLRRAIVHGNYGCVKYLLSKGCIVEALAARRPSSVPPPVAKSKFSSSFTSSFPPAKRTR